MSSDFRVLLQALAAVATLSLAGVADAQGVPADRYGKLSPERAADLVSRMTLQEKAGQLRYAEPAIPRLSAPAYNWWNEGLRGEARAGEVTVFPQAVAFELDAEAFAAVDAAGVRSVEPGAAELWIGGGQPIARPGLAQPPGVAAQLQITGRKGLAN